ncbi:2-oxo acid dehydrogenase subunit E2 [Candidatus Pacearchaeota archaeon]|nr:2-oxo acid dehydrogenase subunit E2 [Candidatus Pacearchaeota archaeon]
MFEFKFPDVGEGIEEGEIVEWNVKEGDTVKSDQVIGKVETDKAVVDIPSPKSGKILKILVKTGQKVKVGQVMIVIGEKGEKYSPLHRASQVTKKEPKKAYGVVGELEVAPEGEVLAMPRTRKIAEELGIDLSKFEGVVKEEELGSPLHRASQETESKKPLVKKKYDMYGYIDRIPFKSIRKAVAQKMSESWQNVPHVTHMDNIIMDELIKLRDEKKKLAEKKKIKMTYLPFIVKAVLEGFKKFPILNSSLEENEIIVKKYFNIGIAVATDEGLMVPVIKGADKKDILQIAQEIEELAEKARKRSIDLADLKGGTFTITNIGSVGGKFFTPIVNYPESSILGLGRMEDKVFYENNKVIVKKILPVSFSFDHRIADGGTVSAFMNLVKELLENPKKLKV